jgi:hypothetical protein
VKSKLFLTVFYALASFWALLVLSRTGNLPAWQAWGMALLPAFLIGALGLRMYGAINVRDFIEKCRRAPKYTPTIGDDPLAPCQTMYRQPYFDARQSR